MSRNCSINLAVCIGMDYIQQMKVFFPEVGKFGMQMVNPEFQTNK